jgi:hypothetical protein
MLFFDGPMIADSHFGVRPERRSARQAPEALEVVGAT